MSRQALKDVLLDLKSQMRGARASSYIKKGVDAKADKDVIKPIEEASGDSDKSELGSLKGRVESSKEPTVSAEEGPVDFADEMKKFMKKRNSGKGTGPSRLMTMATEPTKAFAPKKKGK